MADNLPEMWRADSKLMSQIMDSRTPLDVMLGCPQLAAGVFKGVVESDICNACMLLGLRDEYMPAAEAMKAVCDVCFNERTFHPYMRYYNMVSAVSEAMHVWSVRGDSCRVVALFAPLAQWRSNGFGEKWKLAWMQGKVCEGCSTALLHGRDAPTIEDGNEFREAFEAIRHLSAKGCGANWRAQRLAVEMASQWTLASEELLSNVILGTVGHRRRPTVEEFGALSIASAAIWMHRKEIVISRTWMGRLGTQDLIYRAARHSLETTAIDFVNYDKTVPLTLSYAEIKESCGRDTARQLHAYYTSSSLAPPSNVRFTAAGCTFNDFCDVPRLLLAPDAPDPCKFFKNPDRTARQRSDQPLIVNVAVRSAHINEDLRDVCIELLRRDPHVFDTLPWRSINKICRLPPDHAVAPMRRRLVDIVALPVALGMSGRVGAESPLSLLDSHTAARILSIALIGRN
jgi:hypothetical protein